MVVVKDRFLIGHNPGHDPKKYARLKLVWRGYHCMVLVWLHCTSRYVLTIGFAELQGSLLFVLSFGVRVFTQKSF